MAEAYHLPIAPHDCTGPVLLAAAVHLSQNATNTLVQEVVRSYYHEWYGAIVTKLPPLENLHSNSRWCWIGHGTAAGSETAAGRDRQTRCARLSDSRPACSVPQQ